MGAIQYPRGGSSIVEITNALKEDELEDAKRAFGLINDVDGAARNRRNIEQMRKNEGDPYAGQAGMRYQPELPRPQSKKVTQEVIEEDMNIQEKYDGLIPVIIEDLKTMTLAECEKKNGIPYNCLAGKLKTWRNRGLLPEGWVYIAKKSTKSTGKVPEKDGKSTRPSLPPWNESWGDVVKAAWLHAWEYNEEYYSQRK